MSELFQDPDSMSGDLRMLQSAIFNGYPITPENRKEAVDSITGIITGSVSDRDKVAATRVLVAMEAANLQKLTLALSQGPKKEGLSSDADDRIIEVFKRLGFATTVDGAVTGRS